MKKFIQMLVTIITLLVFVGGLALIGVGISTGVPLLGFVGLLLLPGAGFFLYKDVLRFLKK